jgi:hypothetical protein
MARYEEQNAKRIWYLMLIFLLKRQNETGAEIPNSDDSKCGPIG